MRSTTGHSLALLIVFITIGTLRLHAERLPSWDQPPDLILRPSPYVIHPGAQDLTHRFEIPTGQIKDRWIRGFQFQSCDPQHVQGAHFYVDKTGQWLGTWTPGETMISFPETVAAWLPATAKVIMEIHYASMIQDTDDCSSIGLYFTERRPLRPLMQMGVQTPVEVPGGTAVELKKEFTVITDSYAFAVQPEMRAAGRSVEVTAVDPSGASQILYGEKDLETTERTPHFFDHPVFMPKGTRIIATASYRNADPETAVDDVFRLNLSLYPRGEFHPTTYEAVPARSIAAKRPATATKKTSGKKVRATTETKKTTSKKPSSKKHSL